MDINKVGLVSCATFTRLPSQVLIKTRLVSTVSRCTLWSQYSSQLHIYRILSIAVWTTGFYNRWYLLGKWTHPVEALHFLFSVERVCSRMSWVTFLPAFVFPAYFDYLFYLEWIHLSLMLPSLCVPCFPLSGHNVFVSEFCSSVLFSLIASPQVCSCSKCSLFWIYFWITSPLSLHLDPLTYQMWQLKHFVWPSITPPDHYILLWHEMLSEFKLMLQINVMFS